MTSDTGSTLHGTGGNLGRVAGRSNSGKSILHTIDPKFIFGIGQISEFGSRKYHMRNFLMAPGMEWSAVYDSMLRHLMLWWSGEEFDLGPNGEHGETDDPDTNMKWSGLPHLLHAAWNIMVLFTYETHGVYADGDDRPSKTEQAGVRWQDWKEDFDEARGLKSAEEPEPVPEQSYETRLSDALDTLEELGFKPSLIGASGLGPPINEHGEWPHKVLADYMTRDPKVKRPAFLNDPLRSGMKKDPQA